MSYRDVVRRDVVRKSVIRPAECEFALSLSVAYVTVHAECAAIFALRRAGGGHMARKQGKASGAKKKMKDLDPKAKGKNVKGGAPKGPVQHAGRILNRDVSRVTDGVGEAINDTGGAFNRTLNPR
jgi:hypothetical protein